VSGGYQLPAASQRPATATATAGRHARAGPPGVSSEEAEGFIEQAEQFISAIEQYLQGREE